MKTYLITGGTGTLGNALVERLHDDNIIRIYSRDEYKQYNMRHYKNCRFFIGDVRDRDRLDMAMEGVDIVIHAAALKHTTNSEYNPFEFIKTNVIGTQNVIDMAMKHRPEQVLFISTDKAVNPENLYGATKMCAERLISNANNYKGKRKTVFKFVRYGNVWGSRGSVLERWNEQDVFEVRDMAVTRFHLTPDDAVNVVLDALESSMIKNIPKCRGYKLRDLAVTYKNMTGKDFIITSPLPGEKTNELLDYGVSSHNADMLNGEELRELVSDFLNRK